MLCSLFPQEHHLQRALSAQQVYGTAESLTIPIPEVDDTSERYGKLYSSNYKQPKQFIHMQGKLCQIYVKLHCTKVRYCLDTCLPRQLIVNCIICSFVSSLLKYPYDLARA